LRIAETIPDVRSAQISANRSVRQSALAFAPLVGLFLHQSRSGPQRYRTNNESYQFRDYRKPLCTRRSAV